LLALQKLLGMVRDVIVGLLDLGETIAVGLLDFVEEMIEKIKTIITAPIRLPFISDLMELREKGTGSLPFSLLDATTLILAIPVTAVYKAIFKEAPFKMEQALDPVEQLGWLVVGGIGNFVNQMISGVLDALKGDHFVLECACWVCGLAGLAPQINDWAESLDPASHDKLGQRGWNLGFRMWDVIDFFIDSLALLKCEKNARRAEKEAAQLSAASFLSGVIREIVLIGKMIADFISNHVVEGAKVLLDIVTALPRVCGPLMRERGSQAILWLLIIDAAATTAGAASTAFAIDELSHPAPGS
jgi:hypothetical protein